MTIARTSFLYFLKYTVHYTKGFQLFISCLSELENTCGFERGRRLWSFDKDKFVSKDHGNLGQKSLKGLQGCLSCSVSIEKFRKKSRMSESERI